MRSHKEWRIRSHKERRNRSHKKRRIRSHKERRIWTHNEWRIRSHNNRTFASPVTIALKRDVPSHFRVTFDHRTLARHTIALSRHLLPSHFSAAHHRTFASAMTIARRSTKFCFDQYFPPDWPTE